MTVGFNTASKSYDNYNEAWWEILECAYNNKGGTFKEQFYSTDLPSVKQTAANLEGSLTYTEGYFSAYYHKDFFVENHENTFFAIEDNLDSCNVNEILAKWGFSPVEKYARQSTVSSSTVTNSEVLAEAGVELEILQNTFIISAPKKFKKKSAEKIRSFDSANDLIQIDTASFGIDDIIDPATAGQGKGRKALKKLAKQDIDFIYDQKKGGIYFNENGAEKGFGDGGIIAILKGAPNLTSDNLEFI